MLDNERYVSLSTWTKDGDRKRTPVWIALLSDGQFGFTTGEKTWKVRRIQKNPIVEMQSCNFKGELIEGSEPFTGLARVAGINDKEYTSVKKAIRKKYGIQDQLVSFFGRFSKKYGESCAVVISLEKEKLA